MPGFTTRLGLSKPGGGSSGSADEVVDIDVLNVDLDKLDDAVGVKICTSTTRPSTPFDGQIIREFDTRNTHYWSSGASRWTPIGIPNVSSDAQRDALLPAPSLGDRVYRTDPAIRGFQEYTGSGTGLGWKNIHTRSWWARTGGLNSTTTTTNISWDATLQDSGDFTLSNGVFTTVRAGIYQISSQVMWTAPGATVGAQLQLVKNGTVEWVATTVIVTGGAQTLPIVAVMDFAAGDTWSINLFSNVAAGLDIANRRTMVQVARIPN